MAAWDHSKEEVVFPILKEEVEEYPIQKVVVVIATFFYFHPGYIEKTIHQCRK
jgi:hypothetical protein